MADAADYSSLLNNGGPPRASHVDAVETTPLLTQGQGGSSLSPSGPAQGSDGLSARVGKQASKRWPSIVAITILAVIAASIVVLAYFVPDAVEEYAKQGAVVEPTNLSLESITTDGVRARIQANFRLDGSRVNNGRVRRIGQATTTIVRKLSVDKTAVNIYLLDYDSMLLGRAEIPPFDVSLVDGHTTAIDFVANLVPGDAEGIRNIANQWLEGRLDKVRLRGEANISLAAGFVPLGQHPVSESLTFEASQLPGLPKYEIDHIVFEDVDVPDKSDKVMGVQVSISAFNRIPVAFDVPSLAFDILVPNCNASDPYIEVAYATTSSVAVRPNTMVRVDVNGTVQALPDSLISPCPGSESSPLDLLLKQYMNGDAATIYVRGKSHYLDDTPKWIGDILKSITVPVPFPGGSSGDLIRDFSLTDVRFILPNPNDPDSNPTVSGTVLVTAGLPSQVNFAINVTAVRATSDVFYASRKLGEFDIDKWQAANSTMTRATKDHEATLKIQSRIEDAPLNVTDSDVLTEVIQKMLFLGEEVDLDINGLVDVRVDTVLGRLELKDLPAEGKLPVKPFPSGSLSSLAPQVGNIEILGTTPTSITLKALVNVTNPTDYTAHIPFIGIHIVYNETVIGTAKAENLELKAGNNTDIVVGATWNPSLGGDKGLIVGRNLLSEFVSGINTSLTIRAYHESIPFQPVLSDALSRLNFTVHTPRLSLPNSGKDGGKDDKTQHSFIRDATFHIFSSSATFVLASPLSKNTLYIEAINATAFYNHTEPVGTIVSDAEFGVPPGLSETPKLPVKWSPDSVGFDKLRKALGGVLELDAKAEVDVRLGTWRENIRYEGSGIGAHVRP